MTSDQLLRLAAVEVETDMRPFEGALDEDWCHFCPIGDDTLCGAPMSGKVPPHFDPPPNTTRCKGCGRRKCPDCVRIDEAQNGR